MSESEINRIKKVLGNHYSQKIIEQLNKMQIVNSSGNPYSAGSIRKIVNGNQPNEEIELQILKIVAKAEKKQFQLAEKRKLLTQS
ncbi:MAG: hypothetical protein EOP00_11640 [Pedobacter sp.]|nr:MAG: hypothetical protein EOP00_11640 [Pedobacter sp.]